MIRPARVLCAALMVLVSCGDDTAADRKVAADVAECAPDLAVSSEERTLNEVAILGEQDEEEPTDVAFGAINHLAVSEEGNIFVLDALSKQVIVLSSTGSVMSRRGRAGAGPGEFETPWKVHVSPDGHATVLDTRLWRLTTLDTDDSVTTQRLPPDVGMGQIVMADFDAEGRLYNLSFESFEETLLARLGGGSGRARGDLILRRWEPSVSEWRNLSTIPGPETYYDPNSGLGNPPYAHGPVFAAGGSGFWYGDSDSDQLTFFDPDGTPRCSIHLPFERLRVSDEERQEYYAAEGTPEERRQRVREVRASIPMPEYKPTMTLAMASKDGNVWLDVSERRGTRWWYFDLNRGVAHPVRVPEPLSPVVAEDSRLYGVYRDSMGVPYVGIYEVVNRPGFVGGSIP